MGQSGTTSGCGGLTEPDNLFGRMELRARRSALSLAEWWIEPPRDAPSCGDPPMAGSPASGLERERWMQVRPRD